MKNVKMFYTEAALERLKKKYAVWSAIFAVLVFALIAFCIFEVATVDTANEASHRTAVTAVSALGGCVAIYVGLFPVYGTKRAADHAALMLAGGETASTERGRVFRTAAPVMQIPKSVRAARVSVDCGGDRKSFSVCDEHLDLLPEDGEEYLFFTVHGFITGYAEADDEGD